ncbi:tetratricopeptide repeat protein [Microbispora sp. ZYX-F-249]|uniref:Tetratricopeptide repeat protein n=1 Tax=Microbispora maris TaxID=3144104 RepID=A0ABV0AZT0_9ACTN
MARPPGDRGDGVQVFLGYLTQARSAAWNPSVQWLSRHSGIPRTTVESLVDGTRKRLPNWTAQVERLLEAYREKVTEDERGDPDAVLGDMAAWRQAYDEAQNGRRPACPLPMAAAPVPPPATAGPGRPIGWFRPLDLEVHPAIRVDAAGRELEELPAYIPRSHDETLAQLVSEARAGESRLVVLVGDSSTGKTRALWEAVRTLPESWRLWHPIEPSRPAAVLTELRSIGPYTVVWLNESQHYLLTADPAVGERIAGGLRELLRARERGPVLVLGTLWPAYWKALTAVPPTGRPDPYAQARELIKNASIRLPESFTGTDLDTASRQAGNTGDPRLAEALRRAPEGRLTQYLAGGPALLELYDNAEPAARAVLDAAIDARRLGHGPALPHLLLAEAAPGYLGDEQWHLLGDDWLERALAYLTDHRSCRGARPPLTRLRPRPGAGHAPAARSGGEPAYRLADYLEQHGARTRRFLCPPATFWNAATRHAASVSDHRALAKAARDRGRNRHAFALHQAVADAGDTSVLRDLARMREQTGEHESAERLARAAADAGHFLALWDLARAREQTGDQESADRLARAALDARRIAALLPEMAREREQAGDHEGAEHLARAAADAGHTYALFDLAATWIQAGDHEGARRLYQAVEDAEFATDPLAEMIRKRQQAGDHESAERLARAAADTGHTTALRNLAQERHLAGDYESAERMYQAIADAGDTSALDDQARAREQAGDHEGAERLYRAAADAGHTYALRKRAREREEAGDHEGAERLYQTITDAGHTSALGDLARIREQAGDHKGAERLTRAAADAGDTYALRDLARMREQAGDHEGAERLYRTITDSGSTSALRDLARIREQAGDHEGAERLARAAADTGHALGLRELGWKRKQAGDYEGAERFAQAAVDTGDTSALWDLAEVREQIGDQEGAERFARAAADIGNIGVLDDLSWKREKAGDYEGAERLYQAIADTGHTTALRDLARVRERAGDQEGAERFARAAADAGRPYVLYELTQMREQAGDHEGAERLARIAADAGDATALYDLAKRRVQKGQGGRWADLLRFGLEADGSAARPW